MAEEAFVAGLEVRLKKARAEIARGEEALEKAEAAGIDVAEQRTRLDQQRDQLAAIETVYLKGPAKK